MYPRLSPRGRGAGAEAGDGRRPRPPPPLIERSESDSGSCGDDMLEQMIQQTMGGKVSVWEEVRESWLTACFDWVAVCGLSHTKSM